MATKSDFVLRNLQSQIVYEEILYFRIRFETQGVR